MVEKAVEQLEDLHESGHKEDLVDLPLASKSGFYIVH